MAPRGSGRKVRVTITLPATEVERLKSFARRHHRPLAAELRWALDRFYRGGGEGQRDL